MQHGSPVLDYSESDLEVPEPQAEDLEPGDLVVIRSSVRFEKRDNRAAMIAAGRQLGKTSLVQKLYDILNQPDVDEVGIVIDTVGKEAGFVDVLWCRKHDVTFTDANELSIVQRA